MLNGHNNEYIILFGNEQYNPAAYIKVRRYKYSYGKVADARKWAKMFKNAYVFKVHYDKWGDMVYIERMN